MLAIKILAKKYIFVTILDNLSPNFIVLETQIIKKEKNIFMSSAKKSKGFTLVELIIVITILAILATVAFISFKNYNNTARDSVRVTDIKTIFEWLSIYKVKSWIYPLPNNPTQISAGNNILTYQGEISKGIKQLISLNGKWTDPKDATNYVYAVDATQQKWQLLWYLENWDNIKTISLFPQIYANLSQRYVYIYWDKLGIITDENNTPIQYTTTNTWVNILDNEYAQKELITYIWWDVWNGWKTTSTWNILAQEIESSLSGTLSCGEKSYNGYILSWLSHNQTWTFIKENSISHGTQNLQLTITCINGEFDTIWATENIVNTTCTTWWYIPYNNTCVENKCQNNLPLNATSTATSENHQVSWNYQETPWECSFECNINYTYNSWSNTCEPNSRTQSCSSIPSNSVYNSVATISQTWNGTEWFPNLLSTHNTTSSSDECRFVCNAWYTYNVWSNLCTPNNYIVTFNGNGWSWFSPTTKTVVANTTLGTLPTSPTRNGYIFLWWYSWWGAAINESTIINSSMTVYANWQEQPKYYAAPVYLWQSTWIFDNYASWRWSVTWYPYVWRNAYPWGNSVSIKSTCSAWWTYSTVKLGASYYQTSLQWQECTEDGIWYVLSTPTNCCFTSAFWTVQCNFTAKIYRMPCQ